jgi:assimilatory nitrate reductase catalytic subunit
MSLLPAGGLPAGGLPANGPLLVQARDFPTNRGGLCQKGWTAGELLDSAERLTTPLVRASRDEPFRPATWDEALGLVVAAMKRVQSACGPDGVAVFGGGGLTNEKAYLLGKFARVALGTSSIDYNGRFCMSSAAAAGSRAFGIDRGLPFPLPDLAAADVILLAGSNAAETMPPFTRWLAEQRAHGGSLIVIDPRLTPTARRATLHLQITFGTDLALANGLLHIAIAGGHVDTDYVAKRTSGFGEVRRVVAQYWPERVERITGVTVAEQRAAVRLLAGEQRAMVLTARGAEQHSKGTDTVSAFINFALALGLPGTEGGGYGCLTGQGNGQGGREHGQKADQLPGYRRIDDPAAREHVAAVWGIDPATLPGPGRSAFELLDALGTADGPGALLVMGSNVAVSAPSAERIARRLAALDFLVVCDLVLSETAALADVVLPVAQWAEETGTMTNLEGRVLLRRRAMLPPAGIRTDLEVLAALAGLLDAPGEWNPDPELVFGELRRASAGGPADYAGISYDRIAAEDGLFWPCPADEHPGTPRMFLDTFRDRGWAGALLPGRAQAGRRGHRRGIPGLPDYRTAAAALPVRCPDPAYSGIAQRAARAVRRDASRSRRGLPLRRGRPDPGGEPAGRGRGPRAHHRDDPGRHGVHAVPLGRKGVGEPGDQPGTGPGVEDARVQGVCGAARGGAVTRRVVVVGNGMAGFRFVQELLSLGGGFEVTVIGDEPGGAYNRVQLPNVLAGAAPARSVELADHGWLAGCGCWLVKPPWPSTADSELSAWPVAPPFVMTCLCLRPVVARCCRRFAALAGPTGGWCRGRWRSAPSRTAPRSPGSPSVPAAPSCWAGECSAWKPRADWLGWACR